MDWEISETGDTRIKKQLCGIVSAQLSLWTFKCSAGLWFQVSHILGRITGQFWHSLVRHKPEQSL
ncbi:hypothetical protein PITC_037210 [Penicillium italicum]|uniref:Uncharacterized protein n=1 Tax=Penicillium italicum TaxID=40296 RepID=A0A0A2LIF0_PENIT|nr:hypothetical protein PITC_037210 [Penicillium italicum]